MAPPLSAMGGLLVRHPDGWRWSDGSIEPRVRDLTAAEAFELPRVRSIDPTTDTVADYVSIPRSALDEDADLLGDVISFAGPRAIAVGGDRGSGDGGTRRQEPSPTPNPSSPRRRLHPDPDWRQDRPLRSASKGKRSRHEPTSTPNRPP